jgi:hypothetical protein
MPVPSTVVAAQRLVVDEGLDEGPVDDQRQPERAARRVPLARAAVRAADQAAVAIAQPESEPPTSVKPCSSVLVMLAAC